MSDYIPSQETIKRVLKNENSDDFNVFMNICKNAQKIWGNKFTYTLINE